MYFCFCAAGKEGRTVVRNGRTKIVRENDRIQSCPYCGREHAESFLK